MNSEIIRHPSDPVYESVHNINDGLEFIDDAIRTKDQPFMYANQHNAAAASPWLTADAQH